MNGIDYSGKSYFSFKFHLIKSDTFYIMILPKIILGNLINLKLRKLIMLTLVLGSLLLIVLICYKLTYSRKFNLNEENRIQERNLLGLVHQQL